MRFKLEAEVIISDGHPKEIVDKVEEEIIADWKNLLDKLLTDMPEVVGWTRGATPIKAWREDEG